MPAEALQGYVPGARDLGAGPSTPTCQPLGQLAIDPEILEWIRVDGEAKVREELARASPVRLSLEQDPRALEREEEALLSLRLRELVTDEVFTRKRAEIHTRRVDAQAKLAAPERTAEEFHQMVVSTLTIAAKDAFLEGPERHNRTILEAVGSDNALSGRRADFKLELRFDRIAGIPLGSRVPPGESSTGGFSDHLAATLLGLPAFEDSSLMCAQSSRSAPPPPEARLPRVARRCRISRMPTGN